MDDDQTTSADRGEGAYYTSAEASRALGVSRQRIHQLLNDGILTGHIDERTGRWRIHRESVLSYARARTVTHYHPQMHALRAEVGELIRRLGAAESRIAVLDSIERERSSLTEELYLIRGELSGVRQELVRLAALFRGGTM